MISYSSSQKAYDSIGIGKKCINKEIFSAFKKFIKIIFGEDLYIRHDCHTLWEYLKNCKNIDDLFEFFNKFCGSSLFRHRLQRQGCDWPDKRPRLAQTNDGRLVLWGDVYDELDERWQTYSTNIINKCLKAGIHAQYFEKKYPTPKSSPYDNGNVLEGEKFYTSGYSRIYRGVLRGFIIDIPKKFKFHCKKPTF